jgi:hypothetical protein
MADFFDEYAAPAAVEDKPAPKADFFSDYEAPSREKLIARAVDLGMANPVDSFIQEHLPSGAAEVRRKIAERMVDTGGKKTDIALNIALPIAGAIGGGLVGGPVGAAAGGGAMSASADRLIQARQMARGERKDFSTGETVASGIVGAFVPGEVAPAASALGTIAKTVGVRAAQGTALGAAHEVISDLIDDGKVDWGRVATSAGWSTLFGGALGSIEGVAPYVIKTIKSLGKKAPAESADLLAEAAQNAPTQADKEQIHAVQTQINEKLGIGREAPSAQESALALSTENPPVVKPARESAEALTAAEQEMAANRQRYAEQFNQARAEEVQQAVQANQLAGPETTTLGDNAAKNQLTAIETRPGESIRERARVEAQLAEQAPQIDVEPTAERLPQAQRMYDNYGYVRQHVASTLAGGAIGAAAGSTQGDTAEDRLVNATLFGLAGAAAGAGLSRGLARALEGKSIQEQAQVIDQALAQAKTPELQTQLKAAAEALTTKAKLVQKYPEAFSNIPDRQLPVEIKGTDGKVYPAIVNGYYDLPQGAVASVGRLTESGQWSHGMLRPGEEVVTKIPSAEAWAQGVRELSPPPRDAQITVMEMGGKRAVQVDIPGAAGERPAFSGSLAQAEAKGYDFQVPDNIPQGKYSYHELNELGQSSERQNVLGSGQEAGSPGAVNEGQQSNASQSANPEGAPQELPTVNSTSGSVTPRLIRDAIAPAGGTLAGAAFGATQGNTPEERRANALRYGVLGFGASSIGARMLLRDPEAMIRSVKATAAGTENLPEWFLRFRDSAPILRLRETIGNNPLARIKAQVSGVRDLAYPANTSNPYLTATDYPGVVAARVKREAEEAAGAVKFNIDKSIQTIASGTSRNYDEVANEFNEYLRAKTAKDYNREHMDYTAETGKPASGITDDQAHQIVQAVDSGPHAQVFQDLQKQVRELSDQALQMRVDGGLITKEEAAALRKKYPEHVPLNRILDDEADPISSVFGVPRFNTRSSGLKEGYGSDKAIDDVLTSTLVNLKDAIIRAEKNKVGQAELNFVEAFKPEGTEVRKPAIIGTGAGGMPIYADPPSNALVVRRPGPNGKTEVKWIEYDEPLMAQALNGIGVDKTDPLLRFMGRITGTLGSLYTKFSAPFQLSNKIRDIEEVAANIATSGDARAAAGSLANSFKYMGAVHDALRGNPTPGAQLFHEADLAGAFTGGLASASRDTAEASLQKFSANQNPLQRAKDFFQNSINYVNTVANESTYLGVYAQAKEAGATPAEAAIAARKASIDFNLKSPLVKRLGSLYAFIGPGIHGATGAVKMAVRDPKTIAEAAAVLTGVSMAADAINNQIDPEWKEKRQNDFYRMTSIPLAIAGDEGGYYMLTIPIAQSLRPVKAMADMGNDIATGRKIDPKLLAQRAAHVTAETFNPLGSGGDTVLQTISPTVSDPIVDVAMNRSFSGSKIKPDQSKSGFEMEKVFDRDTTTAAGKAAIAVATKLKEWGLADVSPEAILYYARGYGGGPAQTLMQGANMAGDLDKSKPRRPSDFPIIGSFIHYVPFDAPKVAASQDPDLEKARIDEATGEIQRKRTRQEIMEPVREGRGSAKDVITGILTSDTPRQTLKDVTGQMKKLGGRGVSEDIQNIRTLSAEDGARAKFIAQKLTTLPQNERIQFFQEIQKPGDILTKSVAEQVAAILAKQNP